jgi:hypothetical protein
LPRLLAQLICVASLVLDHTEFGVLDWFCCGTGQRAQIGAMLLHQAIKGVEAMLSPGSQAMQTFERLDIPGDRQGKLGLIIRSWIKNPFDLCFDKVGGDELVAPGFPGRVREKAGEKLAEKISRRAFAHILSQFLVFIGVIEGEQRGRSHERQVIVVAVRAVVMDVGLQPGQLYGRFVFGIGSQDLPRTRLMIEEVIRNA